MQRSTSTLSNWHELIILELLTDITVIVDSLQLGPPDYTVLEDVETFSICLNISSPPSTASLPKTFDIVATTADGTAQTGMQLLCYQSNVFIRTLLSSL